MTENNDKEFNVDDLLQDIFKPVERRTLRERFDQRLQELKISQTSALDILKIESRALNGILDGTQKRVDFSSLIKISDFLQMQKLSVVQLYIDSLEKNFSDELSVAPEKIEYIKENFDLAALKKAGFIKSLSDFSEIENRIVSFFGLKTIFDYKRPSVDVAFSSGLVKPNNELTRSFWVTTAKTTFEEINNQYPFDREALIKYFPQIRWHSTNVELGLKNVISDVFKMGVTVAYLSPLPSLHLRGATFSVNDKPCIVLTDYVGFYPTLWFALIHELFHVLFDWDEIKNNEYHLSGADEELLTVVEKEKEADNFAREYLFSKEKTNKIKPYLHDKEQVVEFAYNNHVHPSFIYVFSAYDSGSRLAWSRAKNENPDISNLLKNIEYNWSSSANILDYVKTVELNLYK